MQSDTPFSSGAHSILAKEENFFFIQMNIPTSKNYYMLLYDMNGDIINHFTKI